MFYQIDNLKNYKAEVFLSEEGLALDTSAFNLFTGKNDSIDSVD